MTKKVFFSVKKLPFNVNFPIDKYIKKGYELISLKDILKEKELYWSFFNQYLSNTKYSDHINNIPIEYNYSMNYPLPNMFNKHFLFKTVKKHEPELFKNHMLDLVCIKKYDPTNTLTDCYKNTKILEKFMKKNKWYIVKPEPGHKGMGMKLCKNKKEVDNYIYGKFNKNLENFFEKWHIRKWLIQEYIDKPLLIDRKKFHLRVLVLHGTKNEEIFRYMYNKFMIFPALKDYDLTKKNKNIHNSHSTGLNVETINKLDKEYAKINKKTRDDIHKQISHICKTLFKYIDYKCFKNNKNCFKFIGYDFMITHDYKVMLLELNKNPGFNIMGLYDSFWKGLLDLTMYHKTRAKDYTKI